MGCTYGVVLRMGNAIPSFSKNVKLRVLARNRGGGARYPQWRRRSKSSPLGHTSDRLASL
jgi:hypothetical protein